MEDFVSFGSRAWFVLLLLLLVARGMDLFSTWLATPNMVLEGNPIAKKLGWRWGIPVNLAICFLLAYWPLPAIVISTTSVLVAARNFQSAWLMRSLGEQLYREWHVERVRETSVTLYLLCLFGQTILTAGLGVVVMYFSDQAREPVLLAIGLGIVAYALAVTVFTLLGIWRLHRAALRETRLAVKNGAGERVQGAASRNGGGIGLNGSGGILPQGK